METNCLENSYNQISLEEVGLIGSTEAQHLKIGRLGNLRSVDPGYASAERRALIPDETVYANTVSLGDVGDSAAKIGITGTYTSRLYGTSSQYFAEKILNSKK